MTEEAKDGFVYPDFSPNTNPFAQETNNMKRKSTDPKISNEIADGDDSGDYTFLYWNQ